MVVYIISSGVRFSFGVFVDPLVEAYGWSRGDISLAYTLQFLLGIPVVLVVGWLAERISGRRIVVVGAAIFTIGMLLTAGVTKVWQFQLSFGALIGGLGSAGFIVLLPVLVSRWFYRKLGLAMGLLWVSLSLGPALFSPIMRWAVETVGWSQTFIVVGLIGGPLMLAAGVFLRDHPQEKELTPYGGTPSESQAGNTASLPESLSLRRVAALPKVRALTAVHALGCVGHSIPLAHVVSMATLAGIPGIPAAGILSVALTSSIISRFGMSLVADAKGARFTLTIALLLQTFPMLLLLSARELQSFYAFAFLFGLGFGGEMVGFPIFNRQYYGVNAPLNTIYAYQMAGALLGMAVGGWLGGVLFDWTGGYTWSIVASLIAGSLGVIVSLLLPSRRRPVTAEAGLT